MKLGAHISTAGGLHTAYDRAIAVGCETMLIFTKSNRQWAAKPLTKEEIELFQTTAAAHPAVAPTAVHATYLINIASPKPDLWEKSVAGLKMEIERAAVLGIPLLTFHPGSHVGAGEEAGLANIGRALVRLLAETAETAPHTTVCLETMAGQGTNLGSTFEQLAQLIAMADGHPRLGVCLDTCHIFAAGYDIRTPATYEATIAEFDSVIGLDRLKFFHFNDSQHELGSNKDRHEHIGRGFIGEQGFANFVNDPRFAAHPAHLETPKEDDDQPGVEMDAVNLATLRGLIAGR